MSIQSGKPLLLPGMKGSSGLFPLFFWLIGGLCMAAIAGSYGCANIGAPTGGPKDTLPPVLLKMYPENFTPNFKNKLITLNFDEYVDLDNPFENLIINPPLEKFPLVERKLRTITIKIKDTLEENMTYSWRFDDVIKDVNEGNPFQDFTYVFSTGPYFDSAALSGRVIAAETGKIDSTLIVVLHNNLSDSAIKKVKPRYITKLDGKGFFRFTYLAPGTYNVFALKDDGMKRYSDTTAPFAFYDTPIEITENSNPVEMLFFSIQEEKKAERDKEAAATTSKKKTRKTEEEEDEEEDEELKSEKKGAGLRVNLILGQSGNHDVLEDLSLNFSQPLASFDSTLLLFTDTLMRPVGPFSILRDTAVANRFLLKHAWKMDFNYQLIFLPGSAKDSSGLSFTKSDTIRFKTKAEKDYGSIKLTLTGLDFAQNPVLQWIEGGKIVKRIRMTSNTFTEKIFKPGDYEINVLLDTNQNGVWDTGNYRLKKQPERVIAIPKKINIRGNWENEYSIDINAVEADDN